MCFIYVKIMRRLTRWPEDQSRKSRNLLTHSDPMAHLARRLSQVAWTPVSVKTGMGQHSTDTFLFLEFYEKHAN